MHYVVTHFAVRYGELQERCMYTGRSKVLAWCACWISGLLFMQSLDAVTLDSRANGKGGE